MSFVRIWVHAVFATKNRLPMLTETVRPAFQHHLLENARKKGLYLDCIGGHCDHLHCLLLLNKDTTISKTLMLLKGESSYWANHKGVFASGERFGWQDDYFAVSVGEAMVEKVRGYIQNQEAHHQRKTFEEEAGEFARKYGWDMRYFFR